MKQARRILCGTLVLLMMVSLFSLLPPAEAASFSYNPGTRGVTCTALSTKASAYYSSSYSYATLSAKSASALKTSLATLMTSTHSTKTTYSNLTTYSKYSDAKAGSSSKMTLFYTSNAVSGTWDSGKTWNREHVWPQSLGSFTTSNCGSDLHHVRPADVKVNSTRGNLPYGYVRGGSYSTAKTSAGTVGGYYTSSYFEPLDSVKGDVARILLYCYVRWGESNLTDVIQSTDLLLSWCKSDPVDTWEMGRNDVVQGIQGNRNVFIDYPEYAWLIFGKSVPTDMTTPSGMAASGSSGSGSGGGSTTYTVSWGKSSASTGSGTVSVTAGGSAISSGASVASGTSVKFTFTPASGSTVSGVTVNGSAVSLSASGSSKTYTVTASKNLSAVVTWGSSSSSGGSSAAGSTATLVSSAPSDWTGNYVLVGVNGSTYYVLDASGSVTSTTLGSSSGAKTLSAAGITRSGSTLSGVSDSYVYTVGKTGSYYYFKMKGSANYLTYKAKGLTTSTTYSGTAAQWTLSLSSGAVRMRSRSATSYYLGFNSNLFRCYSSTGYKLYLYKVN